MPGIENVLVIQDLRLSKMEMEAEDVLSPQGLLDKQIGKVLRLLCERGIHGYPGGNSESFCLWPIANALNLPREARREDEWRYPDDVIGDSKEPGTLIWIPDSFLGDLHGLVE